MISEKQRQKIWLLSDTVLYPEAVTFIRQLMQEYEPLPTSQIIGLLNIVASYRYDEILRFITHQRDRNWPESKKNIKEFYTQLEKLLTVMKNKRVKDEFHLLGEGLSNQESAQEVQTLMAELAREFVQHVVAENGLLDMEYREQHSRERTGRR